MRKFDWRTISETGFVHVKNVNALMEDKFTVDHRKQDHFYLQLQINTTNDKQDLIKKVQQQVVQEIETI
jgi:hypothetical protein